MCRHTSTRHSSDHACSIVVIIDMLHVIIDTKSSFYALPCFLVMHIFFHWRSSQEFEIPTQSFRGCMFSFCQRDFVSNQTAEPLCQLLLARRTLHLTSEHDYMLLLNHQQPFSVARIIHMNKKQISVLARRFIVRGCFPTAALTLQQQSEPCWGFEKLNQNENWSKTNEMWTGNLQPPVHTHACTHAHTCSWIFFFFAESSKLPPQREGAVVCFSETQPNAASLISQCIPAV